MNKVQVHIVFKDFKEVSGWEYYGNEFVGVFFDRKSAQDWIDGRDVPHRYFIETYEQPEAGMAHEVFA